MIAITAARAATDGCAKVIEDYIACTRSTPTTPSSAPSPRRMLNPGHRPGLFTSIQLLCFRARPWKQESRRVPSTPLALAAE
jgi:hypothetical protein